jgi:hypothetical protein
MALAGKHCGIRERVSFSKNKKRVCFVDLRTFVETPTEWVFFLGGDNR